MGLYDLERVENEVSSHLTSWKETFYLNKLFQICISHNLCLMCKLKTWSIKSKVLCVSRLETHFFGEQNQSKPLVLGTV